MYTHVKKKIHSDIGCHGKLADGRKESATRAQMRKKTLKTEVPIDGLMVEVDIAPTLKRREGFNGERMLKGILGKCEAGTHMAHAQQSWERSILM